MATSDDIQGQIDAQNQETDEGRARAERLQAAKDARQHAEEFQGDAQEAEQAALDAERAVDAEG